MTLNLDLLGIEEKRLHEELRGLEHGLQKGVQSLATSYGKQEAVLVASHIDQRLKTMRSALRSLEQFADEQDTPEQTQLVSKCLQMHKLEYERLKQHYIQAQLQLKRKLEKTYMDQRKELLGGSDVVSIQRKLLSESQVAETSEAITNSLRQSRMTMQQQLEQTGAVLAVMDTSNHTLGKANTELRSQEVLFADSKSLLRSLDAQSKMEWVLLWGSLTIFLLVAGCVFFWRLPFMPPIPNLMPAIRGIQNTLTTTFFPQEAHVPPISQQHLVKGKPDNWEPPGRGGINSSKSALPGVEQQEQLEQGYMEAAYPDLFIDTSPDLPIPAHHGVKANPEAPTTGDNLLTLSKATETEAADSSSSLESESDESGQYIPGLGWFDPVTGHIKFDDESEGDILPLQDSTSTTPKPSGEGADTLPPEADLPNTGMEPEWQSWDAAWGHRSSEFDSASFHVDPESAEIGSEFLYEADHYGDDAFGDPHGGDGVGDPFGGDHIKTQPAHGGGYNDEMSWEQFGEFFNGEDLANFYAGQDSQMGQGQGAVIGEEQYVGESVEGRQLRADKVHNAAADVGAEADSIPKKGAAAEPGLVGSEQAATAATSAVEPEADAAAVEPEAGAAAVELEAGAGAAELEADAAAEELKAAAAAGDTKNAAFTAASAATAALEPAAAASATESAADQSEAAAAATTAPTTSDPAAESEQNADTHTTTADTKALIATEITTTEQKGAAATDATEEPATAEPEVVAAAAIEYSSAATEPEAAAAAASTRGTALPEEGTVPGAVTAPEAGTEPAVDTATEAWGRQDEAWEGQDEVEEKFQQLMSFLDDAEDELFEEGMLKGSEYERFLWGQQEEQDDQEEQLGTETWDWKQVAPEADADADAHTHAYADAAAASKPEAAAADSLAADSAGAEAADSPAADSALNDLAGAAPADSLTADSAQGVADSPVTDAARAAGSDSPAGAVADLTKAATDAPSNSAGGSRAGAPSYLAGTAGDGETAGLALPLADMYDLYDEDDQYESRQQKLEGEQEDASNDT